MADSVFSPATATASVIALQSLMEETDRTFFTDYAMAGKTRGGTTVVVSEGTDVPEIMSGVEERRVIAV